MIIGYVNHSDDNIVPFILISQNQIDQLKVLVK